MRPLLTLFVLAALATASLAGDIRNNATAQIKPNSIWFEDADQLARWQEKKRGDPATFGAYQENILHERAAWQFINPLEVRILRYESAKNRAYVQMTGEGRLRDSKWFVDPEALVK